MKKILFTITFLVICGITSAQKSTTIKVTYHPGNTLVNGESVFVTEGWKEVSSSNQNCFPYLNVRVFIRSSGFKSEPYKYKFKITNNSNYTIENYSWDWSFGNESGGNLGTLSSGETEEKTTFSTDVKYPSLTIRDINFKFDTATQNEYGVRPLSDNFDCGQTIETYLFDSKRKKEEKIKENKIRDLKRQISKLGNTKTDLLEKQKLYQSLSDLDNNNNYKNELENIQDEMRLLAKKEIEDEKNTVDTNENTGLTAKTTKKGSSINQSKKEKDDFEKIKEEEKRKQTEAYNKVRNEETKRNLINSLPNVKRRMEYYKSIGDWSNYNKEKETYDYITKNLLTKQQQQDVAVNDLVNNVANLIGDVRDPDFQDNRLVINYTFNDFNEVNMGFSHKSVWGKFFMQIDFKVSSLLFEGWEFEKDYIDDSRGFNQDIINDDVAWRNFSSTWINEPKHRELGIDRIYRKKTIFSIGGGLNFGFGFYIPTNRFNIVVNGLGLGRVRTKSLMNFGYKYGFELHFASYGFGLHYKNTTYRADIAKLIISADNRTYFSKGDIYTPRIRKPYDVDNTIKNSAFEFSFFILL